MTIVLDRRTRGMFTKQFLTSLLFERQIVVLLHHDTAGLEGRCSFAMEIHEVIGVFFYSVPKLCYTEAKVSPKETSM
jgi:hypothetical protein